MRPRLASVGFLNALPLIEGLAAESGEPVRLLSPAAVADALDRGEIDLGLVPVVEAARLGLHAVAGIGVAAAAEVRSVLVVARVELARVRTLALDPASRTSAALARLLFRVDLALDPATRPGPGHGPPLPHDADAALVIGDRALTCDLSPYQVTDLASWWHRHSGHGFVFAVWAGPDPERVAALAPALARARDRGLARLATIAGREGPRRGIDEAVARDYLERAIRYEIGPPEAAGLERFLELLRAEGILESSARLRFAAEIRA